ncbi:MAG: hypothetical protein ACREK5_06355 [Gemmatimonadota bacterium]
MRPGAFDARSLGYVFTLISLSILACGGSEGARDEGSAASPESEAPRGSGGLVSSEAIERCAGFTAEDAAAILGVGAADVEDRSRDETARIRMCSYALTSDPFTSVSFNLSARESAEDAAASLASEREMMGAAQGAIEGVMGEPSGDRAYQEIEGVGDEAFWSPLNRALMTRVGNVIVQVTTPDDVEKQKEVARMVAEGLGN